MIPTHKRNSPIKVLQINTYIHSYKKQAPLKKSSIIFDYVWLLFSRPFMANICESLLCAMCTIFTALQALSYFTQTYFVCVCVCVFL